MSLKESIDKSNRILKLASDMSQHYYGEPLVICYSGGKDSDVILRLAMECLEPEEYEVLHSVTTLDSPVTNKYVNDRFAELKEKGIKCKKSIPVGKDGKPTNMWKLIQEKQIPPTRLARYCCAELKETSTPNRIAVLGVRSDESAKRQGRDVFGVRGGHTAKLHFFRWTTRMRCIMRLLKEKRNRMEPCGIAP
jgi:phosphoadenosine phosphosulfate reductase